MNFLYRQPRGWFSTSIKHNSSLIISTHHVLNVVDREGIWLSHLQVLSLGLLCPQWGEESHHQQTKSEAPLPFQIVQLIVSSSFGKCGQLPWMIRNLPSNSRSSRSLITLSPTCTFFLSIRLEKVFRFICFSSCLTLRALMSSSNVQKQTLYIVSGPAL